MTADVLDFCAQPSLRRGDSTARLFGNTRPPEPVDEWTTELWADVNGDAS